MKTLSTLLLIFAVTLASAQTTEPYKPGPDSQRQPNVPKGTLITYKWESKVYPGTKRSYYVYVPAQYTPTVPAALMVFQDGFTYLKEEGDFRVTIVYDNLIHKKQLPVTICLFVDPGYTSVNAPENLFFSENRANEYDELNDQYAGMLINEIIPEVKKSYNISDDRNMHGIGGLSSGGICAFTAAWFRTDYFSKVLSHVGSFVNIRGGHSYPYMIRKNQRKDIRVFLQDGNKDLDNIHGNWWIANQAMDAALKFKGYDYKFEAGEGGHNGKHGGAILPESLVWLWR